MSQDTDVTTYRFSVSDVFRFSDGSTVFVGDSDRVSGKLTPAEAEIVVDGTTVARVVLSEERMPGPSSGGRRTVVTRDDVDVARIKRGECRLLCRLNDAI